MIKQRKENTWDYKRAGCVQAKDAAQQTAIAMPPFAGSAST